MMIIGLMGCGKTAGTPSDNVESTESNSALDSTEGTASVQNSSESSLAEEIKTDYHELLNEADTFILSAEQAENVGQNILGEYYYGLAQAELSSLRYAIDYILWLKGEGDTLADVVGTAPYGSWEEIAAVSPSSPATEYFEGLLYRIQGKTEEEQECLDNLADNPRKFPYDFYALKSTSVEELYVIREEVLAKETALWDVFEPRTILFGGEISGAEYIPEYQLWLAQCSTEADNAGLAAQCAINAMLAEPTNPDWYYYAAVYGFAAGREDAIDILTEGVFVFPENEKLNNLLSAVIAEVGGGA